MLIFIVRRMLFSVVVVVCVATAVFLLTHAFGNPARIMLPFNATDAQVARFSHQEGFDQPLLTQYLKLWAGAIHGDFGISYWQHLPATGLVLERLPHTLVLAGAAMVIAMAGALPIGIMAAVRSGSIWDRLAVTLSLVGVSVPAFWLGELLIIVFAVNLPWLPTNGFGGPEFYVLPTITLAALPLGRLTQIVRTSMLDQLGQQYMLVGRANGLSERRLIYQHALKNAAIPIVTLTGWELGRLLAGFTVLVEFVFNWPGVGLLALQAIQHRDLPLIEADVTIVALLVVTLNLLLDIAYAGLDPRIKKGSVRRRRTTITAEPEAA
jgi:peptide/nickel transport system permease protein